MREMPVDSGMFEVLVRGMSVVSGAFVVVALEGLDVASEEFVISSELSSEDEESSSLWDLLLFGVSLHSAFAFL